MQWRITPDHFPRLIGSINDRGARDKLLVSARHATWGRADLELLTLALCLVFVVIVAPIGVVMFLAITYFYGLLLGIAGTFAFTLTIILIGLIRLRRIEIRLIDKELEVLLGARCAACGHNLAGLEHQPDDARVCPECGRARP